MPSPIAHLTAGYAIYALSRAYQPGPEGRPARSVPLLLVVTTGFSLLPDLDSVVGVLAGDFGRFHNNLTHSLLVGAVVALTFAVVMRLRSGNFWYWFMVSLAAYELHVVMDWATYGRGVMAWWPLTDTRFLAPVSIFYGLHWSQGLISVRHVWTVVTELAFVALTAVLLRLVARRRVGVPA